MQKSIICAIENVRDSFCAPVKHVSAQNSTKALFPAFLMIAQGIDHFHSISQEMQEKLILSLLDVNIWIRKGELIEQILPHIQQLPD